MLATSHIFGAHMGWAEMAAVAPIAERAALAAVEADSEEPVGALRGWPTFICAARRLDSNSLAEFEVGVAAQSELLR